MNQSSTPAYVPGVCNINRKEIEYRRKVGYIGLAITIVLTIILMALSVSRYYRIIVFLPAIIMASGFIQAKNKFCVGYGAAGTQNAEEGGNTAVAITDKEALAKDKAKTRRLNLQAFGVAILVTLAIVLLPEL